MSKLWELSVSNILSTKTLPVIILVFVLRVTARGGSPTLRHAQSSFHSPWARGDLRNPKFKELATYAETRAKDGREYSCIVDHVVSARTKVKNGIMYKISYIATQTNCRPYKGRKADKCKPAKGRGKKRPCDILIHEPSEGPLHFLSYHCGNWMRVSPRQPRYRARLINRR
ncbi:mialostatin-like [Amblyomma americanum]